MNNVNFTGRIATELELRTSKNDTSFVPFNLAVRTALKDENGKHKSMFLKCVVFRTNAELIMLYCRKGNLLGVSGSLAESSTINEQGQKISEFKVMVDKLSFLEPKKEKVSEKVAMDNEVDRLINNLETQGVPL